MKVDVKRLLIGKYFKLVCNRTRRLWATATTMLLQAMAVQRKSSAKVEGDIKLWVDTEHIDALQGQVDKFEKEYPDVKVTVAVGSSADAKADVSKDP